MQEQIVGLPVAKLAKDKGFTKVWCNNMYCIGFNSLPEDEELIECDWRDNVDGQFHLALAPTQSLLQKWLREIHQIHVEVNRNNTIRTPVKYYTAFVQTPSAELFSWGTGGEHQTYEEALEEGLKRALELVSS